MNKKYNRLSYKARLKEYSNQKKMLENKHLSHGEYEAEIKRIVKELGI